MAQYHEALSAMLDEAIKSDDQNRNQLVQYIYMEKKNKEGVIVNIEYKCLVAYEVRCCTWQFAFELIYKLGFQRRLVVKLESWVQRRGFDSWRL